MNAKKASQENYVSKLKYVLAGIGAFFCVVFAAWLASAVLRAPERHAPSDLSLHPEQQNEIVAKRRVAQLQKELGLTDEQAAQATTIFVEARQEGDAAFMDTSKDIGERIAAGRGKMEEASGKLKAILTDEQKGKFDELLNARRSRGGARGLLGNWMQQGSDSRRNSDE